MIVSIDGLPVNDFAEFMGYLLTYKKPGDTVEITAIRNGQEMNFDVVLSKRP